MKTTSACSFHDNSMNKLLSYHGLVDARISASEKDLPVLPVQNKKILCKVLKVMIYILLLPRNILFLLLVTTKFSHNFISSL